MTDFYESSETPYQGSGLPLDEKIIRLADSLLHSQKNQYDQQVAFFRERMPDIVDTIEYAVYGGDLGKVRNDMARSPYNTALKTEIVTNIARGWGLMYSLNYVVSVNPHTREKYVRATPLDVLDVLLDIRRAGLGLKPVRPGSAPNPPAPGPS